MTLKVNQLCIISPFRACKMSIKKTKSQKKVNNERDKEKDKESQAVRLSGSLIGSKTYGK